jgi:hypothetical protein
MRKKLTLEEFKEKEKKIEYLLTMLEDARNNLLIDVQTYLENKEILYKEFIDLAKRCFRNLLSRSFRRKIKKEEKGDKKEEKWNFDEVTVALKEVLGIKDTQIQNFELHIFLHDNESSNEIYAFTMDTFLVRLKTELIKLKTLCTQNSKNS